MSSGICIPMKHRAGTLVFILQCILDFANAIDGFQQGTLILSFVTLLMLEGIANYRIIQWCNYKISAKIIARMCFLCNYHLKQRDAF